MYRKIISLTLSLVMVFSMGMATFATENISESGLRDLKEIQFADGTTLKEIADNSFLVNINGLIERIKVAENADQVIVSILNEETGVVDY